MSRLGQTAGAIVIGGDYRGLGVVRALGRRGIPVCVLTDEHTLAALSRYCNYRFKWPRGTANQMDLLYSLAELGFCGWSLFPTGDESAALISRHQPELADLYLLTTPPWQVFKWAYDKTLTYRLADQTGIPHPSTFVVNGRDELARLALNYPALLKPARKHRPSHFTRQKAWLVRNRDEMLSRYDEARTVIEAEFIMVQEFLTGGADSQFSYAALVNEGSPLASLVAQRRRQYPIVFGNSSSFVRSIDYPEVEHLARELLAAMHFTGLVEVEFMRDANDSQLKLLDVNPRVWGWHTLGARAGVDFAYLAWRLANGLCVPPSRGAAGISWLRFTTDALTFLQHLRRGELSPRTYIRSLEAPLELAIWAADDPLPALFEVPTIVTARLRLARTARLSRLSMASQPVAANDDSVLPPELTGQTNSSRAVR